MSVEIKKEDPLEYAEYQQSDYNDDFDGFDEEDSTDYEQTSTSQANSSKARVRVNNPTPIAMPTKEEIMSMSDLNWRIALQRHKTTQELGNDSRTKIAKLLIKNIYERKYQLDGNYDLKFVTDFNLYRVILQILIF